MELVNLLDLRQELRPRELTLLLFAALILVFGLFPAVLLDLIKPSAAAWAARFR